jgi:hypothetical protein
LNDDVFDDKFVDGEIFGIGIGFGVLEESGDEANRLFGPAT